MRPRIHIKSVENSDLDLYADDPAVFYLTSIAKGLYRAYRLMIEHKFTDYQVVEELCTELRRRPTARHSKVTAFHLDGLPMIRVDIRSMLHETGSITMTARTLSVVRNMDDGKQVRIGQWQNL